MTARELYVQETGNTEPNDQIAYHQWFIEYKDWLERKVIKEHLKNNPIDNFNQVVTAINEKYGTELFKPEDDSHQMMKLKDVTLGNNYIGDISFQKSDLLDGIKETLKQVVDRINAEKKNLRK
jgi:hypothetical protein